MFIVKYKKIFLIVSVLMVLVSAVFIFVFGLKAGIDFKGGALLEVGYSTARPEVSLLENKIKDLNIGQVVIQPTAENDYLIKSRDLSETEHQMLLKAITLDDKYAAQEKSFISVG